MRKTNLILSAYSRFIRAAAKLVDASTAQDIAQETVARLIGGKQQLERDEDVVPYGITIARHLALDELARRRRFVPHDPNRRAPGGASLMNRLTVQAGLRTLGHAERTAVERRYFDGCSSAEIAAEAGVNTGLINVRLSRGRQHMREVLGA